MIHPLLGRLAQVTHDYFVGEFGGYNDARSRLSSSTIGNDLTLASHSWSEYRQELPQARLLIEAAALQDAFRNLTGAPLHKNITIDFCNVLLCDDHQLRAIFLRCWEKGNLGELLCNDTFQSFVRLSLSNPQEQPEDVSTHHATNCESRRDDDSPPLIFPINDASDGGDIRWPRRLLHIPSMTAVERTGRHTYNGIQKPAYCVLTYTWGRYREKEVGAGPVLKIHGIDWSIPSIKKEHFTAEAFHNVIQRMGREVEWAWIDVACVEQREEDQATRVAKAEEIGRQAEIFKGADRAFVWLNHLSAQELEHNLKDLKNYGSELKMYRNSPLSLKEILGKIDDGLSAILKDPWFTSLWTLQEIILRNDAVILTREGDTVQGGLDMVALAKICNEIREQLISFKRIEARRSFPGFTYYSNLASRIIDDIDKAGFPSYSSTNPNVLYELTQYRETSRTDNRVRAIVQVYKLNPGINFDVDLNGTAESQQLEVRFAAAICGKCPILGQRFLHRREPPKGRSWCITQYSVIPSQIKRYKKPKSNCTISVDSRGHVMFQGQACLLVTIEQRWERLREEDCRPLEETRNRMKHFEILLDGYLPGSDQIHIPPAQHLFDQYGRDNVVVLKLGTVQSGFQYHNSTTQVDVSALEHSGIIARKVAVDDGVGYERVGLCLWNPLAGFGEAGENFDEGLWEDQRVTLT